MFAIQYLLTIFLAVTVIFMVAILSYCILDCDSDINGCDSVPAYYILGSDSDINGCDACLLYSWQ